jgi:hypothetical protein
MLRSDSSAYDTRRAYHRETCNVMIRSEERRLTSVFIREALAAGRSPMHRNPRKGLFRSSTAARMSQGRHISASDNSVDCLHHHPATRRLSHTTTCSSRLHTGMEGCACPQPFQMCSASYMRSMRNGPGKSNAPARESRYVRCGRTTRFGGILLRRCA